MVLLPLLRSLPVSSGVSLVAALASTTGLDFGVLRLGHPDTAADALVASMMAFSVAVPVFWSLYMVSNGVKWLTAAVHDLRRWRGTQPGSEAATHQAERHDAPETADGRAREAVRAAPAAIASLQNVSPSVPPD